MLNRPTQTGAVISVELLLIAVILAVGLLTGWTKLRDQSLSELKDSMAAIDTYLMGSEERWQTGGTPIIRNGTVSSSSDPVREEWVDANGNTMQATAAEPVPGRPGVYRSADNFLSYGADPVPSTMTSGAGETVPQY